MRDDFNDGVIHPQWRIVDGYLFEGGSGATVTEKNGRLEVFMPVGTRAYRPVGLKMREQLDISDLDVTVDVGLSSPVRQVIVVVGQDNPTIENPAFISPNHYRFTYTGTYFNGLLVVKRRVNGVDQPDIYSANVGYLPYVQMRITVINERIYFYFNGRLLNPAGDDASWLLTLLGGFGIFEVAAQTEGLTDALAVFDNYIEERASAPPTTYAVTVQEIPEAKLTPPTGTWIYPAGLSVSVFADVLTRPLEKWLVDSVEYPPANPLIFALASSVTVKPVVTAFAPPIAPILFLVGGLSPLAFGLAVVAYSARARWSEL